MLGETRGAPHEAAATDLLEAELRLSWGEAGEARALLHRAEAGFAAMGMVWHQGRLASVAA